MRYQPGSQPAAFLWATGIEDTFVPQARPGHRPLDEYQLMGHYEHWREDLALLEQIGVRMLRWGVPWYRVEPLPGEFDWSWVDQVLAYMIDELCITPIIDLMHYGCPFWLRREFASSEYPEAVATYARAFAQRYAGKVRWYTPLNEPIVNALMCGKRGLWPPYLRGDSGFLRVMINLIKGIRLTVAALQEVDPEALMVHVEATGLSNAAQGDLESLAIEEQLRQFLPYDLLTGKVTFEHPLFVWLVRNGVSAHDLAAFAARPLTLDLLGLNFYPQWSTQQLYIDRHGKLAYRAHQVDGANFAELIRTYYNRYRTPIMVTETSAVGSEDVRARWLESSVRTIKDLRASGVPVVGYTWFPLFTMIDWRYRFGRGPREEYLLDLGLFKLAGPQDNGRWQATPLVEQFRSYVADPEEAIGPLQEGSSS
jgi:beta-glucosidase